MDYDEMLVSIGDVRKLLYKVLPKNVTTTAIEDYVGDLSAVVKPVVRGEWKPLDKIFYCSQCEKCYPYRTNFCPNCGADMRKEANDGNV